MRFCFDNLPLINDIMSFSSVWHCSKYFFNPWTSNNIASSIRRVQYILPTQRIVWPGQSSTQTFLNLIGYAWIASITSLRILFRIIVSNSINHFSTCPLAAAVDILSISLTSSSSVDIMASTSRSSSKFKRCMPSKHFFKCGWTLNVKAWIKLRRLKCKI